MTERFLRYLEDRSNRRGIVVCREARLLDDLALTRKLVDGLLDQLVHEGRVDLLAPLPFLVLRFRKWSGKPPEPSILAPAAYSYSKLSSKELNKSYSPTEDRALMYEILDTLGETDPTSFEGAIKNFSPDVIRKALDRVRRTRSLRKNRTALFRYLLTKLS